MSIYNYNEILLRAEKKIQNGEYSEKNKELIFKFESYLFSEGLSKARISKYLSQLSVLTRDHNLELATATKDDIYRVVGELEKTELTHNTKYDYKVTLKRFFRWMNDGEDPEQTKWIKLKNRDTHKLPEELLSEEEVLSMIDTCTKPRDKALIAVLYDSGCRISEIGNLQLKHLNFDQYGAIITVDGKTGMRRVRIIFAGPYLANWLDHHPDKKNPNAFLWINLGLRNYGEQMRYDAFRMLVKRIAKKAGIKKRIHNHLFRHSRSTELAQHLTQAQMEEHLGWIHGSKMPRTYIHLSGKQVDDALLRIHGFKKDEDNTPLLTNVSCKRCKFINGPASEFCCQCGAPLKIETAITMDEKRSDLAMQLMEIMQRDPKIADIMREIK